MRFLRRTPTWVGVILGFLVWRFTALGALTELVLLGLVSMAFEAIAGEAFYQQSSQVNLVMRLAQGLNGGLWVGAGCGAAYLVRAFFRLFSRQ